MDTKLDTFVSNDPKRLLKLTKRLFDKGFFNCYLSSQQFNLLNLILYSPVITDENDRLKLWQEFMNGNISLAYHSEDDKVQQDEEEASHNNSNNENNTNTNNLKTEDVEDIELNLKKGLSSSRNLLSKVRYLLWEQLLDYYYALNSNEKDLDTEYEILEIEDEPSTEELKQNGSSIEISNSNSSQTATSTVRGEEDDYDDDEEEEEEDGSAKDEKTTAEVENSDKDTLKAELLQYNDNGELVLDVPLSTITAPAAYPLVKDESIEKTNIAPSLLGPSSIIESDFEKKNELKLIRNFNKIYHSFEHDKKNLAKRRKLEESDKRLASLNNSSQNKESEENDASASQVNKLISFGGAANLSLKNLLSKIDQSRDKLQLSDIELRNLILDVRKNRSKWASDDKIGQEELYEACERVVLELRGYTEHSTAFLNKVSKREAPNYYQVIKHPMDLNTVMKKLKAFQYKKKQEFVDDLMLIWRNCLTYNSDPSHFIRTHAIAMQKQTMSLTPLIPDITIRDRAEVEKEEAELHKDDEKEPEDHHTSKGTRGAVSSTQKGAKLPKKGKKRSRDQLEDAVDTPAESGIDTGAEPTPVPLLLAASETSDPIKLEAETDTEVKKELTDGVPATATTNGTATTQVDENEDDEEDNDQQQQVGDDDNEEGDEDLEYTTWSNLTANARFKICTSRSELFKENKLQPAHQALLRNKSQMSNFTHYLGDSEGIIFNSNRLEFLDKNEHDDPYLIEYDVTGGIPTIPYQGVSFEAEEKEENELVSKFLNESQDIDDLEPSSFVPNPLGLNKSFEENILLIQEIRKICFKVSLIRQMQSQAFVHHSQMKPPEIDLIQEVDIDPVSRLDNKDFFNREVCYNALKRNVSKILMSNGFETGDPFCVDVMTQVAEDYMSNLIKSIKLHSESQSINKIADYKLTTSQIICLSLVENGIQKPDVLHTYVRENICKQTTKLKDIKTKLSGLLKDLLRPGFQATLNEKQFSEDSEQYLTGDFANEIGDDFFGFRQLGLDKEFGMISQTIPLHLLHARLHNYHSTEGQPTNSVRYEDIFALEYPPLNVKDIPKQIGLLRPFYESLAEKSKHFYLKQRKKEEEENADKNTEKKPIPDDENMRLVEDDELPNKQRNSRPKVPPTGKIPGIKKKTIESGYFIKKEPAKVEEEPLAELTGTEFNGKNGFDSSPQETFADGSVKDDFTSGLSFPINGTQIV